MEGKGEEGSSLDHSEPISIRWKGHKIMPETGRENMRKEAVSSLARINTNQTEGTTK